ncbi:EscU/YscU/HrcU family type III secretion system export apparatus switch protein [Ferdinandcohnia sp. Marseille-Q9671]
MKKSHQILETKAVALSYDEKVDSEPKVVAKGRGIIADTIIEMAKEHKIPIKEDTNLVELLNKLQVNNAIPEDLFQVVAEVFAFIYNVDRDLENAEK